MSYLPTQGMGGANVAAFGMGGGGSAPPTEQQRSGMVRLMIMEMILAEEEAAKVKQAEVIRKKAIKAKKKVEAVQKSVAIKKAKPARIRYKTDKLKIFIANTQKEAEELSAKFEKIESDIRASVAKRAENDPSVWLKIANYNLKVMNEILGSSREKRRRNQQRAIALSTSLLAM